VHSFYLSASICAVVNYSLDVVM